MICATSKSSSVTFVRSSGSSSRRDRNNSSRIPSLVSATFAPASRRVCIRRHCTTTQDNPAVAPVLGALHARSLREERRSINHPPFRRDQSRYQGCCRRARPQAQLAHRPDPRAMAGPTPAPAAQIPVGFVPFDAAPDFRYTADMKKLPLLTLLALTAGCHHVQYSPYTGQQTQWPTAPGAFARDHAGILIYHGPPEKPYAVLGEFTGVDMGDRSLASLARSKGGDAVFVTDSKLVKVGTAFSSFTDTDYTIYPTGGNSSSYTGGFVRPITHVHLHAYVLKFDPARHIGPKEETNKPHESNNPAIH